MSFKVKNHKYEEHTGVSSYVVEWTSQASADQVCVERNFVMILCANTIAIWARWACGSGP